MSDDTFNPESITPASEIMLPAGSGLAFNAQEWEIMKGMAAMFVKSGAFPQSDNMPKLLVKMQVGRELGFQPIQAVQHVYFIHGKVGIEARMLLALMQKAGVKITWTEKSKDKAAATFEYQDRPPYEAEFTREMAEEKGLLSQATYKQHWRDMSMWKVVNDAAKFGFPDICFGISAKEVLEVEMADARGELPENEIPKALQTSAEKKEVAKEEKAAEAEIVEEKEKESNDGRTNYETACYLIEEANDPEKFEKARKYISEGSWLADIANTLVEALMEKKEAMSSEVVDTVEAASEVFEDVQTPAGKQCSSGKRSAELHALTADGLQEVVESNEYDIKKSLNKKDKIQAILRAEYPKEFGDTVEVKTADEASEKKSTLDKLFAAK